MHYLNVGFQLYAFSTLVLRASISWGAPSDVSDPDLFYQTGSLHYAAVVHSAGNGEPLVANGVELASLGGTVVFAPENAVVGQLQPGRLCTAAAGGSGKCLACVVGATPVDDVGNCACASGWLEVDGNKCQLPFCEVPTPLTLVSDSPPARCATCVMGAVVDHGVCACVPPYFATIHNTCQPFTVNGGTLTANQAFTAVVTCPELADPELITSHPGVSVQLALTSAAEDAPTWGQDHAALPSEFVACLTTGSWRWVQPAVNELRAHPTWLHTLTLQLPGMQTPVVTAGASVDVTQAVAACVNSASLVARVLGGGDARPGSTVQLVLQLVTCAEAVNVQLPLPTSWMFLPSSITVNSVKQTDTALDDYGSYDVMTQTVVITHPGLGSEMLNVTVLAQLGCGTTSATVVVVGSVSVATRLTVTTLSEFDECLLGYNTTCPTTRPRCTDPDLSTCCSTLLCGCPPNYNDDGVNCLVNKCATNNGGCDSHATCSGGVGEASTVTCACNSGYYAGSGGGCVAVNACATANGGCDVNAVCTTVLGSGSATCACKAGYTGTGYSCTPVSSTWNCPYPPLSQWDWRYPEPTCTYLSVVYPSWLPAGQANDVNIKIRVGTTDIILNYHNNQGYWSGTTVFWIRTHPQFPAGVRSYAVIWVQVGGSNCHWNGNLACTY